MKFPALFLCLIGLAKAETPAPRTQDLPLASGAKLTLHLPEKQDAAGTAVLICPGGGYRGLVTGGEGSGIAAWLGKHGIAGAVLEYRLPKGDHTVPLADAQAALRQLRNRAPEWKLSPKRIGIIGFSAGGHLAASAATLADAGNPQAPDSESKLSSRPDFAILVYPVISMGALGHSGSRENLLGKEPSAELVLRYSMESQVTPQTPPTLLVHALDDKVVSIEHSRLYAAALKKCGVEHRLLELPSGGHGLNGYKGPQWDKWQETAISWINGLK
jgi:acetyl esterase/lipase